MTGPRRGAVAAAVLLALGCTAMLDTARLEQDIRIGLETQGRIAVDGVSCPQEREAREGDRFECTASTDEGVVIAILVEQTSDRGDLRWDVVAGLLDLTVVEWEIEQGLAAEGVDATVDCSAASPAQNTGDSFTCEVLTADGPASPAVVTVEDDAAGEIFWEWEA